MMANLYASTGPVYKTTKLEPLSQGYRLKSSYTTVYGTADIDLPIGLTGYFVGVTCGKYAQIYSSRCMSIGSYLHNVPVTASMTWRQAITAMQGITSQNGSLQLSGQGVLYSSDVCGGFGVANEIFVHKAMPLWTPGTGCSGSIVLPPASCKTTLSSDVINFNTLSLNQIEGRRQAITLNTVCTQSGFDQGAGMVEITPAWGDGNISLTNTQSGSPSGIAASADINNLPLGKGQYVMTYNELWNGTLGFTLHQMGKILPGEASASAVIKIDYS